MCVGGCWTYGDEDDDGDDDDRDTGLCRDIHIMDHFPKKIEVVPMLNHWILKKCFSYKK